MKSTFFEFFKPDETELKAAWDSGIFTFDANVLLNFYRYSNKTSNELFRVLKSLKSKIWLTHQAGYEYLNNRLAVIHKQRTAYDDIINLLNKEYDSIANQLNSYKKHSAIEIDKIKEKIKESVESVRVEIDKLKSSHPAYETEDKIMVTLLKLFNKQIGEAFTLENLNEIYREAQKRYDDRIPPGYMDKQNKKDSPKHILYGDLLLWKQIIAKAKGDNKPIIMVTDDWKDDWWDKFKGETQGPRKELLREFYNETNQKIYIYQADKFLEYANRLKVGRGVNAETIKEIRDVRRRDEQNLYEISQTSNYLKSFLASEQYKNIINQNTLKINPSPDLIKKLYDTIDTFKNIKLSPVTDYNNELIKNFFEFNSLNHYKHKTVADIIAEQNKEAEKSKSDENKSDKEEDSG